MHIQCFNHGFSGLFLHIYGYISIYIYHSRSNHMIHGECLFTPLPSHITISDWRQNEANYWRHKHTVIHSSSLTSQQTNIIKMVPTNQIGNSHEYSCNPWNRCIILYLIWERKQWELGNTLLPFEVRCKWYKNNHRQYVTIWIDMGLFSVPLGAPLTSQGIASGFKALWRLRLHIF